MNFITFNDFLNCVYVPSSEANQRPSPDEVLEGLLAIYSGEAPEMGTNENLARNTLQGLKMIGAGVVKVVHRCKDARDSACLDLNSCTLLHVPDGVLHLMKHYKVSSCDLSENRISKISPRFGSCFTNITSLNLSCNCISTLPKDIVLCKKLKKVNISVNSFVAFPYHLLGIEGLTHIDASKNFIADVDSNEIKTHEQLEEVNLCDNPVTPSCHYHLRQLLQVTILLSDLKQEDWEDLSI